MILFEPAGWHMVKKKENKIPRDENLNKLLFPNIMVFDNLALLFPKTKSLYK